MTVIVTALKVQRPRISHLIHGKGTDRQRDHLKDTYEASTCVGISCDQQKKEKMCLSSFNDVLSVTDIVSCSTIFWL